MRIESILVYRLTFPLVEPYHLSYGLIHELEVVWVRIQLLDGSIGWGESTPLLGYTDSDIDAVWRTTNQLAATWVGKESSDILSVPLRDQDGFLFTAAWTALEAATDAIASVSGEVPLVGLAQERAREKPADALRRVRKPGYTIFKIKVGFLSLAEDLERLRLFQSELFSGELLRIDANQALSENAAATLLEICLPGKVELFEQPLAVNAWNECARLAHLAPIPIMLDESITDLASLERTARTGAASIVKLKWMKQGGKLYLREMVACARNLGLRVVLGNGVASWINNRHEAAFWLEDLKDMGLAGEMNGYLKIRASSKLIGFQNGRLTLQPAHTDGFDPADYGPSAMRTY